MSAAALAESALYLFRKTLNRRTMNIEMISPGSVSSRTIIGVGLLLTLFSSDLSAFRSGKPKRPRPPVPFQIISHDVNRGINQRNVYILIKESDFTDERLDSLAAYLFNRYRKPHIITVFVHTHESQLRDLGRIGKTLPNPEARKHPEAVFKRISGREEIHFLTPAAESWQRRMLKRNR